MTENQKDLYKEFCIKLSFLEKMERISQSHDYCDIPMIYGILDGKKRRIIYELLQILQLLLKQELKETEMDTIRRFQKMNLYTTDMTLKDLIESATSEKEKEFFLRCGYPVNEFVPEFSMLRIIGDVIEYTN